MSVQRENVNELARPFMLEHIVAALHKELIQLERLAWLILGIQPFSWLRLVNRFPELINA